MKRALIHLLLVSLVYAPMARSEQSSVAQYTAKGSFEEIKLLLKVAIENQGLVVDHTSNVGRMLDRTAEVVGASQRVYEHAEVLQFCSATYSRQVMEADPTLLAFCPFGIGVYTLAGETDTGHLVFRRTATPGLSPAATFAPGSAARAYQHSVFPRGSPYLRAMRSSGCTCTLSFSRAKIILTSRGEPGEVAELPSRSQGDCLNKSPSDSPA